MIKCFTVQNTNLCGYGKFKLNNFYLAKISNNGINTISILDDNDNWIPFDNQHYCFRINPLRSNYFTLISEFYVKNKKDLNKFIINKNNSSEY